MKRIVTDEQAAEIRDGFFQTLIVSREYDENGNETRITARDVVADLIEARELIKEMLPQLVYSRAGLEAYEAESTGETYNSPSLNSIIEKAKEYIAKKCAE